VGLLVYFSIPLLESIKNKVVNAFIRFLAKIGDCSLYIFIYHNAAWLFLERIELRLPFDLFDNLWARRLIMFPAMILLPCLLKPLTDKGKRLYLTMKAVLK
jgi:hypothetical protein